MENTIVEFVGKAGEFIGHNPEIPIAVVVTTVTWLAYRVTHAQLQRAAVKQTLDLFEQFTDGRLRTARMHAWTARLNWFGVDQARYRKLAMKDLFANSIPEYEEVKAESCEQRNEINAIYDMLDFYSLLAYHPGNDRTLRKFTFYYFWWRGFLRSFVAAYEDEYKKLVKNDKQYKQFPLLPWGQHLDHLESRLQAPKYVAEDHPLDDDLHKDAIRETVAVPIHTATRETPQPTSSSTK